MATRPAESIADLDTERYRPGAAVPGASLLRAAIASPSAALAMSTRSLVQDLTISFDIRKISGDMSFAPNVRGRTWTSISRRVPEPSGTQRISDVNSVPMA